jgi:hypothetical protein
MTTVRPSTTRAYDLLVRVLRAVRLWLIRTTGLTIVRVPTDVGQAFELGRQIERDLNAGYIERLGQKIGQKLSVEQPQPLAPVVPLHRDSGPHLAWPVRDRRGPA